VGDIRENTERPRAGAGGRRPSLRLFHAAEQEAETTAARCAV